MADFEATASIANLRSRADLLRRTRAFFDGRNFFEVQTPILSADTVVDRHLDPLSVLLPDDAWDQQRGRTMWLQSSPEFAMKRLLASGADAIYQICPAIRIGEVGEQHNPEFTMLEWYRCGDSMHDGMQLLAEFANECIPGSNRETSMQTISTVFLETIGSDPLRLSPQELQGLCRDHSVATPLTLADDDWDAWFDVLFTSLVQPTLGHQQPVILYDYPASQAALAQVSPSRPNVAERFELFFNGIELANGYHELLDANELRRRNRQVNQQRRADGKYDLPEDSRLLKAMEAGLPACSGVALGFDRLAMLVTGAKSITDVICFPTDRA